MINFNSPSAKSGNILANQTLNLLGFNKIAFPIKNKIAGATSDEIHVVPFSDRNGSYLTVCLTNTSVATKQRISCPNYCNVEAPSGHLIVLIR